MRPSGVSLRRGRAIFTSTATTDPRGISSKSREYQDNASVRHQPFPGSVSEEREIYSDYKGCHRDWVRFRGAVGRVTRQTRPPLGGVARSQGRSLTAVARRLNEPPRCAVWSFFRKASRAALTAAADSSVRNGLSRSPYSVDCTCRSYGQCCCVDSAHRRVDARGRILGEPELPCRPSAAMARPALPAPMTPRQLQTQ